MKNFINDYIKKTLKIFLAVVLAFSVVETSAFTKVMAIETESISSQVSDPDTTDSWKQYFGETVNSTGNAGYVWGDKSVFTSTNKGDNGDVKDVNIDDGNFLIALSSIGANKEIVGYSTIPTDTMFVLDLSNSMSDESIEAMVEAVNRAIDKLLTLNNNNRVGVAVYASNSDLLLTLDSYSTTRINNAGTAEDTSDDYKEYVFVNGNNIVTAKEMQTVTIDFNGVNWTKLAKKVNDEKDNEDKGKELKDYLEEYFPSSDSIDWQDMAAKATAMYGDKPTAAQWEQFIKQNYGTVTVSSNVSCLTDSNGNLVNESVAIGGGTYMQSGLWEAWKVFNSIEDTKVTSGVQAGTKRMPVMVLMSDGAPTYATTSFNNVGTKNRGNGGSNSATSLNAFASQLTAAWIRGKMEEKYDRSALFYSLGLNVGDNEIAKSVLDLANSTTRISNYWDTYLAASNGSKVTLVDQEGSADGDLTVDRDRMVTTKSYVDKYFGASNTTGLINAFDQIVNQIILQSKYYPTLVESSKQDFTGYISFADKLGEYMEVKNLKGILAGAGAKRELYSGTSLSEAIADDTFGNISTGNLNNLNENGDLLLEVIMNRLNCSEADARTALQASLTNGQIGAGDSYIGWYADANGNYLGYWNGVEGSLIANAVYYMKSYIFFGTVGDPEKYNETDMLYIVVDVVEEIATTQQTVSWRIPASLIPLITYNVAFDGTSFDNATNIRMTLDGNEPIRLLYEVGLRSDINKYNLTDKVASDYLYKNDNGTYTFYSNMFTHKDNGEAVGAGVPQPENMDTTWLNFKPSLENERYYYINDSLVLDENHNPVTSIDADKTYYREVITFRIVDGNAEMNRYYADIASSNLSKAVKNDDGNYYIPKGTPYGYLNLNHDTKSDNKTVTLDHYSYPTLTAPSASNDYHVDAYLGNNGKLIVEPAQGIILTKEVETIMTGTNTDFEYVVSLTDANGTAVNGEFTTLHVAADGTETTSKVTAVDGTFTVQLSAGEKLYITDIPTDTTYKITEKRHDDYSVKTVSVNGILQTITTDYHATGTIQAYKLDKVDFVNALIQNASLAVTKSVEYPFDLSDDQKAIDKTFTINVALGSKYSNKTITLLNGNTVMADADGNVQFQLKDNETVVLDLQDGDAYVVSETNLPTGFTLNETNSENLSGTIQAENMVTAKVVNTYTPGKVNPVNVELKGTKTLNGREWLDSDAFTFQLEYFNGTNWVVVETNANDKNTATDQDADYDLSKTLQNIDFTEVGTYRYRVTEINRNQTIHGVTYDNYEHVFDIVVTDDDLNGKLEIKSITAISNEKTVVTYDETLDWYTITADFTNTYAAKGNATLIVEITKQVVNDTGIEIGLSDYTFELYNTLGTLITTSDATDTEGNTKIELVFNQDSIGTMTYLLKERVPNPTKAGMYYDETVYTLTVTIIDNLDGTIRGIVKVNNVANDSNKVSVDFTNVYDYETVTFDGTKELSGREWLGTDSFSFNLYQTEDDFDITDVEALDTKTVTGNKDSKEFTFDEITYYEPGTYYYVIKEENGGNTTNGIAYDGTEYHATVTITRDADKKLSKSVSITDATGNAASEVKFTNVYSVTPLTAAPIGGTKTLVGRDMNKDEFTFNLYEANALYEITAPVALRTTNNAAGLDGVTTTFAFGSITYTTAGDYYYVVKEESGSLGGITYDSTVYRVKVSVVDNNDGTMSATVSIAVGEETKESISFTNRYSTQPTTLTTLGGTKVLSGRNWMETDAFTFDLYETGSNYAVAENQQALKTATATKQNPAFTFGSIEYRVPGTYYYVIKEQSGSLGGIRYDDRVYNVQVDVVDNLDGTLTASIVSINGSADGQVVFENKYNASQTSVSFTGSKVLSGRDWKDSDSFTIELYATDATYEVGNKEALQTKVVRKDATGFTFDEITYQEEGTYYYVIKEQVGSLGGITYDTTKYQIQVVVADNMAGELKATTTIKANDETKSAIVFTNVYEAEDVTIDELVGTKTLNGRDMNKDEFTFILYHTDASYTVTSDTEVVGTVNNVASQNGIASAFTFGTLTFDEVGTYYYVALEEVTENPKNGVTYDTTKYQIQIVVTDDTNGHLVANVTVIGKDDRSLDFVNRYEVTPTPFTLEGTKTLIGRTLHADEFSFELYKSDYTFTSRNKIDTKKNDANGAFTFADLAEQPGTYYYIIEEVKGSLGGVTYDSTYYHVTVVITDNGLGGTTVSSTTIKKYTVSEIGTSESGANAVSFVNTYKATDTDGIVIDGTKSLTGRNIVDAEFTFDLYETQNDYVIPNGATPIQTVNDGNTFAFEAIKYTTTGDYYYVVKEYDKHAGGMEYDTAEYQIHIVVTDNGNGELDAEIVGLLKNHQSISAISFDNTYTINDKKEVVIEGVKELTGCDWTTADEFTFALYETGSDFVVGVDQTAIQTKTADINNDHKFAFDAIAYTTVGTHYYAVKEIAGEQNNGITYDTKQYNVIVVVSDNLNGKLKVEVKYYAEGTEVNTIKFINTYEIFDNDSAYITIGAEKVLANRELKDNEFEFELYEASYDAETGVYTKGNRIDTVSNIGTTITFKTIKYTEVGTHYYIVKEKAASLGGITYDTNEYPVVVRVYDDGRGRLAVDSTINGNVGKITISNTYTITPSEFTLEGTKELIGRTLKNGEFSFQLYKTDSIFENETLIDTVSNGADGKFVFTGLKEQPGTYYYAIREVKGSLGGVTYDTSYYHVTVTVADKGDGTTQVANTNIVKVETGGNTINASAAETVKFTNTYKATDTDGIIIRGTKSLTGREIINAEFTFELYETASDYAIPVGTTPIQTVNDGNTFAFKPVYYQTTGDHYYVVKEYNKQAGGMTYDTAEYQIHVTVSDNGEGELDAAIVGLLKNKSPISAISFDNTYTINDKETTIISGKKVLTGRDWTTADEFTFALYATDSDYEVSSTQSPIETAKATKNNQNFIFTTLEYTTWGTHYYVVKELAGEQNNGITYDTKQYNVKVVVSDNKDGTLSLTKTYYVQDTPVSDIQFTNHYAVYDETNAYIDIRATKVLANRELKDNEFEFELYEASYDAETGVYTKGNRIDTVSNIGTTITFKTIKYTEVGTHYYIVKEKAASLGGITYDTNEYPVVVRVYDDGRGHLAVDSTINGSIGSITIKNTYTITPSSFSLEGTKEVIGRSLNNGEFSFKLYKSDDTFTSRNKLQTVRNDANGKFVFNGLKEQPGTYYYIIEEEQGNLGGITYDQSRYHVTVTIVDNGDGTTKVANTVIEKVADGNVSTTDKVLFRNSYQATDTDGITIEGTKALTGRHMIEGEFAFELYNESNVLLQTVVNKNGKFTFEPLKYDTIGTYTYTVKEKDLKAGGMTYDGTVFTVVIEVVDDGNGELVASIKSIKDASGNTFASPQFKNNYTITEPTSIDIVGSKTFTGRDWTDADEFTFKLYASDSAYTVDEDKVIDTQKATKDHQTFTFKTINYNAEGTYYYVVKEIAGKDGIGISYDETIFNVEVSVVDEHDGTLSISSKYYKGETLVSSINFINTYRVYEGAVAKATISGIKTLTTRAIKDGEFTFELYATASDYVIKPGVEPIQTVNDGVTFTFETIEYDKVGTYYYVVKEMRAGETKDGVTFDEKEHHLKVVVSDGNLGYLVSQIVLEDEEVITVNNTYEITPAKFNLTATKSLTGRQLRDQEFSFELYQADDETFVEKTLIQTVKNDAEGNVTFKDLAQQPGTYYYVMKEVVGNLGGVTYDTNRYHFTVTIIDDEVGSTKVDRVVIEKVTNSGTVVVDKAEFNNTYKATDTIGLVLEGTKSLTGRTLVNGEFVFELYDESDNLVQSTVNKNGKFTFTELKYETTGTYNYTIKEKDTKLGGVTYDSTIYSVKVVVTDDGNGELVAKVESIKNASGAVKDTLAFNNKYQAEPVKLSLTGTKVLTGRQWKDTDRFTFELYEDNQDAIRLLDQAFATNAKREVTFKEIELRNEGVYYYTVKEKAESIGGVTYDTTVYNIKVTLKDQLDGTFSCTKEIFVNDQSVEAIVFNNTYVPAKTEEGEGITLSVWKSLTGRELQADEFKFDLYETDDSFTLTDVALQTKSNDATGAVQFDEIGYEAVGTYYYVVLEKQGSLGGVSYDETQYRVTVRVTDDTNGKLVAEIVSIEKNDEENTKVDDITFENSYQPTPTPEGDGIGILATKVLSGRTLKDNEFLFSLYETDETYVIDSAALETVHNNANGEIVFAELLYEAAGTYYYVVQEEKGVEKNVIYDSSVYHIEVLVTDDLEGHLLAEVVSMTKDGEEVEQVEFKNVYFVNTADDTTSIGWMLTMLVSAMGMLIAIAERRKMAK